VVVRTAAMAEAWRGASASCVGGVVAAGASHLNWRWRLVIVVSAHRETDLFDRVALHGSTWPQRLCIASTLVNNTFSLCPIGGIVALHDPTSHTQMVIFWGARWYKTANCRIQEQHCHFDSSFFPSSPCTYDSFLASSHLLF
jgi:hypothetical protein